MTRTLILIGYAVLALLLITSEVIARRSGRLATLERLITALVTRPLLRLVLLAGWLWLGWHLFVRVDRP